MEKHELSKVCTDQLLVFNAEHLRRILAKYASYYNEVRTHVALGKDTLCRRPIERFGDIVAYPILGGLHPSIRSNIVFGSDMDILTMRQVSPEFSIDYLTASRRFFNR